MRVPVLKTTALCLSSMVVLGGCVIAPNIGSAPGDPPPKIVVDPNDKTNRTWDNPGAFGPVPASEVAHGAAVCSTLDKNDVKYKAIGFHPKAMNIDGQPFAGGGFYCVAK